MISFLLFCAHSQTVGTGDFEVKEESSRIFLSFYIILSIALLAVTVNNLYELIRHRCALSQRKDMLQLQQNLHFLVDMNEGCGVNKGEFILAILEHIGTLDHDKDILPWLKVRFFISYWFINLVHNVYFVHNGYAQKFQEFDTYKSGFLNQQVSKLWTVRTFFLLVWMYRDIAFT